MANKKKYSGKDSKPGHCSLRSSPFAVETSVFDTTSCRGFIAFLKQAGDG